MRMTGIVAAALLASTSLPAAADEALANLVEEVSPSVVTVLSTREARPVRDRMPEFNIPRGSPFEEFFRQFGRPDRESPFGRSQPRQGLGSGFILDPDGWIVTNNHVIEGAEKVTIRLSDDRLFDAEVVGVDPQTDLALLRIETSEELPYVILGDSDEIRVGEDVMAVGNPFGLGGTVTQGIVSAKGRNISPGPYAEFLQTDAAINRGNSGGPLFNMEGEVVGVNSAIYSPSGGSVGVGFAVASNIVEQVIEDLREDGSVARGWLGIGIQEVTPDIAEALGLGDTRGALVSSILEDGPAEGTLRTGDVILAFNNEDVNSSRALPRIVGGTRAGSEAEILILRNGEERVLSVELGEFDDGSEEVAVVEEPQEDTVTELLGATVADLNDDARLRIGLSDEVEGVVVTSVAGSGRAAEAGLRVGDVIVKLGRDEIGDTGALEDALEGLETGSALALVNRNGRQLFVAIDLG